MKAIYFLVITSFIGNFLFLLRETWEWGRATSKMRCALIVAANALLFILAIHLTQGTSLRGGYDNGHDFEYLSENFIKWIHLNHIPLSNGEKELSPLAMFSLMDCVSRFSLDGILLGQKILWFLSSLLVFAISRRAGLKHFSASLAAGLLFFNFLSILNTYAFSTTNANVFYLLSAVYALVSFLRTNHESRILPFLGWLFMASFLVLTARYEFFPVIAGGFILSLPFRGMNQIRASWRYHRHGKYAFLAMLTIFLSTCIWWGLRLIRTTHYNGPHKDNLLSLAQFMRNLSFQIGTQNMSAVFRLPNYIFPGITLALLLLSGFASLKTETDKKFRLLWCCFVAIWILYFSAIFAPLSIYPLQFIRHHLYFFLPFVFLTGLSTDALGLLIMPHMKPAIRGSIVLVCLLIYTTFNLRHVFALQSELRTNDLEWEFLHTIRRHWPGNCKVIGFSDRSGILRKYFPPLDVQDLSQLSTNDCLLFYRSPLDQIFPHAPKNPLRRQSRARRLHQNGEFLVVTPAGRKPGSSLHVGLDSGFRRNDGNRLDLRELLGHAGLTTSADIYKRSFQKVSFPHRFYTNWPNEAHSGTVTIGFYYLNSKGASALLANAVHKQALLLQQDKDYKKAVKFFTHAARLQPQIALYWADLGVADYLAGDYADSVKHLGTAIKIDPRLKMARISRATALEALGKYSSSLDDLNQVLRPSCNPHDPLCKDALDMRDKICQKALATCDL